MASFCSVQFTSEVCFTQIVHRDLTLGEVLDGDRMAVSLYNANFTMPVPHKELCTRILSEEDISKLQEAIEDLYYFEFVFGMRTECGIDRQR